MVAYTSITYDLRQGLKFPIQNFITKQTSIDPSNDGADVWVAALDTFFQKDKELIDYVQLMAGLSAIGKVYVEALIMAVAVSLPSGMLSQECLVHIAEIYLQICLPLAAEER